MSLNGNLIPIIGLILILFILIFVICQYFRGWSRLWNSITNIFNILSSFHQSSHHQFTSASSPIRSNPSGNGRGVDKIYMSSSTNDDTKVSLEGYEESFHHFGDERKSSLVDEGRRLMIENSEGSIELMEGVQQHQHSTGKTLFGSLDMNLLPPKIPPPPPSSTPLLKSIGPSTSLTSTNPFLPIIIPSTIVIGGQIQQGIRTTPSNDEDPLILISATTKNDIKPRLSMGELIFPSETDERIKSNPTDEIDLLEHVDITNPQFEQVTKKEVETINTSDIISPPSVNSNLVLPMIVSMGSGERKFSAPEIRTISSIMSTTTSGNGKETGTCLSGGSSAPSGSSGPMIGGSVYRNRSFSLRQVSTDSLGDSFDLGSPSELSIGNSNPSSSSTSGPYLQRATSCDSVCSDTSVVLGDLGGELSDSHITGYLSIGLEYDGETADLIVSVIEGRELIGLDPDPSQPFDSYVRVYLLPDKTTNMQTRIYRKSLCPVYKEKFMFGLEVVEIGGRALAFYLYATSKYSNTLVGEAEYRLSDFDPRKPITTWLPLTDTGQRGGELGEIMFSLSYLPTAERLTVVLVKARNLRFPHGRDTGDPFVRVYLLQKGKKVSKKKSSTKRGEKNPIFNEAMIFSVPTHSLQVGVTIQLRITVSETDEIEGRVYSIGHVIIGSGTSGKPLSHWNQMLSSLRKPIGMFHPLRK